MPTLTMTRKNNEVRTKPNPLVVKHGGQRSVTFKVKGDGPVRVRFNSIAASNQFKEKLMTFLVKPGGPPRILRINDVPATGATPPGRPAIRLNMTPAPPDEPDEADIIIEC
jgi:hypothetical protein